MKPEATKTKDASGGRQESIADLVGNTPLQRLKQIAPNLQLYAKCEFMNPGGSVKDRIAFHMIEKAEKEGRLKPGQLLVEATGGNTGIGLALVANLKGYRLLCIMTEKVGSQKVEMMQVLGAETMVVPGGKKINDAEHFINLARTIAAEKGAFYVDQFNNPDNLETHYNQTGPEILEQSEGKIDALVAGIGTGGTICGAGRYLKERKPSIELILADPAGSLLAGWQQKTDSIPASYIVEGIGNDFIPGIVNLELIDDSIYVSDQEAIECTYNLLKKEALLVGGSSGCILSAALTYACRPENQEKFVVAILPGSGKYYTNSIFNKQWLESKGINTSFLSS